LLEFAAALADAGNLFRANVQEFQKLLVFVGRGAFILGAPVG
jgi:hypothetical protein